MYRITRPPKGAGLWIAGFVAAFCGFTGGSNMVWTAIVFPKVQRQEVNFTLNDLEKACVASFIHIGQFLATIPSSYMQNAFGRRCVLLMAIPLQLIAWAIIYFLQYVWAILLARVLMGLWIGFFLTCCPPYMTEIAASSVRGRVASMLSIMALFGFVFQSTQGTYLSYESVALTTFLISFILFLALLNIPESVYSLVRSKKIEQAKKSLQWLRGNEDVTNELNRIQQNVEEQMSRKHGFLEIFRWPASRKAFLQAASLVVIQRLSGFHALSAYNSIILPNSWIESSHYPIVWTVINLIFMIISVICVDYIDRKVLLFISSSGTAVFALLIAVWFYLHENTSVDMSQTLWLPMLCLSLHAAFYAFGLFHIPIVFQGEVFPINIKSKAVCLIALLGFTGAIIVVQIFIPLQGHFGNCSNFLLYSFASICGCILSTQLIETRNKTLENIQRLLEGRSMASLK